MVTPYKGNCQLMLNYLIKNTAALGYYMKPLFGSAAFSFVN